MADALEKAATSVLEGVCKHLWGFPPRLIAPTVAQLGPLRALYWFALNLPRYQRTLSVFGGVRTHLEAYAEVS